MSTNIKQTKYIFVSGGVISGIGKGLTTASIAYLLKKAGLTVAPLKFENYLNVDAGTINPVEHGDAFLCEDGAETDMDIGTYEKFLDQDLGKDNFITMGKIYKTVIDRERRFEYNGEDVEAIPHITNEITDLIVNLGKKTNADIVTVELGGTAGEYQNVFYYEAYRLMKLKQPDDIIHIHVSYVPTPGHLGEPKTKPTQLSVKTLNTMGIQPDFIVARCDRPLDQRRKDRLALFCNVHPEDIISNTDVPVVYDIPLELEKQNIIERILGKLKYPITTPVLDEWKAFSHCVKSEKKYSCEIAIIGKYFGTGDYQLRDSYAALFDAIDHASWKIGVDVKTRWVDAEQVERSSPLEAIGKPDGIIVPIGWGERGSEGMISSASYARTEKIPYLGLCFGMQLAIIAFARDVLGLSDANSSEINPETSNPVIHMIPSQEEILKRRAYGGTMRLGGWDAVVKENTQTFEIYKKYNGFKDLQNRIISERHRHRYEFNDKYADKIESNGMIVTARSVVEGLCEIIELPKETHPFYIATQGHPEYKSRPLCPHPLFLAHIDACKKNINMLK